MGPGPERSGSSGDENPFVASGARVSLTGLHNICGCGESLQLTPDCLCFSFDRTGRLWLVESRTLSVLIFKVVERDESGHMDKLTQRSRLTMVMCAHAFLTRCSRQIISRRKGFGVSQEKR